MRIKAWEEMTDKEINDLKTNQCKKCMYFSKYNPTAIRWATCDYIFAMGHSRGCSPLECVEKGIFVKHGKEDVDED